MTTFQIIRPNPEPVEAEATPGRVYRDADGELFVRLDGAEEYGWLIAGPNDRGAAGTRHDGYPNQPLTELTAEEVESELG